MPLDPAVDAQSLTRACHEALILAALRDGPLHGYQLGLAVEERSGGKIRFRHGTLYPILHRLEAAGLIRGSWTKPATAGRRRKEYELTRAGRRYASDQQKSWLEFMANFRAVVEPST